MNNLIIGAGILLMALGIALFILTAGKTSRARMRASRDYANSENKPPKIKQPKWPVAIMVFALAVIIAGSSFTIIPTGYTGVRTTFGLIDQESCMPGLNFIAPFAQKINLVNNKQQDLRLTERISAETDSETVVYMDNVAITYRVVPEYSAWIYANVDNWVEKLVDADLIGSALRSAARKCQNENVTDRDKIEPLAKEELQAALDTKYGAGKVEIKYVVIVNMSFEESYEKAIAKKSAAMQEQQEQAVRNQTNLDMAKAEADAEKARAQGEADADRIRAQGKADANETLANSISENTLKQDALEKWNGELPKATGDNVSFGILDVAQDSNSGSKNNTIPSTSGSTAVTIG